MPDTDTVTDNLREFIDNPPPRPPDLDGEEYRRLSEADREAYADAVYRYEVGVMVRHAHVVGELDREPYIEQLRALIEEQRSLIEEQRVRLDRAEGLAEGAMAELAEVQVAQEVEQHNYEEGRRIEEQRAERERVRRDLYERYLNTYGGGPDLFRHIARSLAKEHGRAPTVDELVQQVWEFSDGGASLAVIEEHVRTLIEEGDLVEHVSVPYGSDDAWVEVVMKKEDDSG